MIVLDTPAVISILSNEVSRTRCEAAIGSGVDLLMSAGTYAELLIVAQKRGLTKEVIQFVENLNVVVLDVTAETALRISAAYHQWGRGFHPAGLNFGDCFAYEAAKSRDCPLLYVGDDFSRTDVIAA